MRGLARGRALPVGRRYVCAPPFRMSDGYAENPDRGRQDEG